MLKVEDNIKGLDIEFGLSDGQRAILSAYVKQEGFDLIQKLFEDQVRKFNLKLIDTNPADDKQVLANHYAAKVAAQLYQGLMDRIREECSIEFYNNRNPKQVEQAVTAQTEEWK